MSKKKRPPVGNSRQRGFRPAPRPGAKQTRLQAYNVTCSDAALAIMGLDHIKIMAGEHIELIQGTDPALAATSHFEYDGRQFTIISLQRTIYICLAHEAPR